MKHHIAVKFLAILLCTLSLLAAVGSAAGIICLAGMDLYHNSIDDLYEMEMESKRISIAHNLANQYASRTLGNCPETFLNEYHGYSWQYDTLQYGRYFYTIADESGTIVDSTLENVSKEDLKEASRYAVDVFGARHTVYVGTYEDYTAIQQATSPEGETSEPSHMDLHVIMYYDSAYGGHTEHYFYYDNTPNYTVTLYLLPGAIMEDPLWDLLRLLWDMRNVLYILLGTSLLICAISAVYLCCAAGKRPHSTEIRPAGLNALPLDLYGLVCGIGIFLLIALGWEAAENLFIQNPMLCIILLLFGGLLCCLLLVGFCFACAAQFKTPRGYWWRHSAIGWALLKIWRFLRKISRSIRTVFRMLPLIWKWIAIGCGMGICVIIACAFWFNRYNFIPLFFISLLCIGIVCYVAYAYGTLLKGVTKLAQGDLDQKVSSRYLIGSFAECANQLNNLADVAQIAAQKQMKSERMKTELITNVSHDIKTPLTSIINYVDLLQKPHTEQEQTVYLEVLSRQSQRLKKLIDDLMDMSKASTGNMAVEITQVDAAESINQALGEFSDKLAKADLTPVFRAPEKPILMMADGRLVWRVMSNLLSNAVKYALPGTRLYLDVTELDGKVVISLKNISREELNVSADELLERFVRGDTARNTEGSGLGLNIAQSLMELQRGQLQLLVDGDLFKVTLVFPAA